MEKQKNELWFERSGWLLIAITIVWSILTRLAGSLRYWHFYGDQLQGMIDLWEGRLEGSYPGSSQGGYRLPATAIYYFRFFTLYSWDPKWQGFAQGLIGFLGIILLMIFLYKVLEQLPKSQRLLWVGVGGAWWSGHTHYYEIIPWNPDQIPAYFILSILLFDQAFHQDRKRRMYASAALGMVLAILVSLHSSSFFTAPVYFSIIAVWHWYRFREWKPLFLSVSVSFLFLFPYWLEEIKSDFENTRKILDFIQNGSGSDVTPILQRLDRTLFNYHRTARNIFFNGHLFVWENIAVVFFWTCAGVSLFKFRTSSRVYLIFWIGVGSFIFVQSNYMNFYILHYYAFFYIVPVVLTVTALASLHWNMLSHKIARIVILTVVCLSVYSSGIYNVNILKAQYGNQRAMNTDDLRWILEELSDETFCPASNEGIPYFGALKFMHRTLYPKKVFRFSHQCSSGMLVVDRKFQFWIGYIAKHPISGNLQNLFKLYPAKQNPLSSKVQLIKLLENEAVAVSRIP